MSREKKNKYKVAGRIGKLDQEGQPKKEKYGTLYKVDPGSDTGHLEKADSMPKFAV